MIIIISLYYSHDYYCYQLYYHCYYRINCNCFHFLFRIKEEDTSITSQS